MPRLTIKHKDRFTWAAKDQNKIKSDTPTVITYQNVYTFAPATQTTWTTPSLNLGGPGLIAVAIHARCVASGRDVSSVTIDGVTASFSGNTIRSIATKSDTWVYYANINNSTGVVSVTFNGTMTGCRIGYWLISNYNNEKPYVNAFTFSDANFTAGAVLTSNLPYLKNDSAGLNLIVADEGRQPEIVRPANMTTRYFLDAAVGAGGCIGMDFNNTGPTMSIGVSFLNFDGVGYAVTRYPRMVTVAWR